MRRTTQIGLKTRVAMGVGTALGTTGLATALLFGASTPGASSAVLFDSTEASVSLEVEAAELSDIAADRATQTQEVAAAAAVQDEVKAERIEVAERATREAERIALEEKAAAAAAAAAAEAAAVAEAAAEAAAAAIASASPRELGQLLAAERGWTGEQWSCLDSLWQRESNWNPSAANPSSGAYGIPQSLPGSKMASAGADWRTNPATQISWGLTYIGDRYGSPCGAWGHSESHNWY